MALIGDWLMAVALVAALGSASAFVAWLLRRSGVPGGVQGAAVCAGVFVGLVAGPGVAANAWPGWYARWVAGGAQESRNLADLREQQRDESAALRAVGVTPVAVEELEERHRADAGPLVDALARARAERAASNDRALIAACALVVALGVLCLRRWPVRSRGRGALGGLVVFGAGVLAPWGAMALLGAANPGALALATGAIGAGVGIVGLGLSVGAVAGCGAAVGAVVVFGSAAVPVVLAALTAVVARVVVPGRSLRRLRRWSLELLGLLGAPAVSALVAVRLDIRSLDPASWGLWLTLVFALVWCSDGRLFAAWLGLRVVHADRPWSRSARLTNAGALVPHLVLTAVGASAGLLDQSALAACVASAVLLALSVGARRLIAEMIEGGLSP